MTNFYSDGREKNSFFKITNGVLKHISFVEKEQEVQIRSLLPECY